MTLSRKLKHKDLFPDPKEVLSNSVLLHAITQANDKSRRLLQVRNRNKGRAKCYNAQECSRLYQRTFGQLLAKPLYRCCIHKHSKGVSNSIHTVNSPCLRARVEVCLTPKKPCWSVSYAKKTSQTMKMIHTKVLQKKISLHKIPTSMVHLCKAFATKNTAAIIAAQLYGAMNEVD